MYIEIKTGVSFVSVKAEVFAFEVGVANQSPLPPLIRAMMTADFYSDRPDRVELRQTHISYVLMAGDYVYKIKKPVRFPFLDYSSLLKRYYYCTEEIRLNRRLAPDVYLGVVAIVQEHGGFALGESVGAAEPVFEYAVKMRRLPEKDFLDRRLREGRAQIADVDRIVHKLTDFYASAPSDQAALYGSPEAIRRRLTENLKEISAFIGETLSAEEFTQINGYNEEFFGNCAAMLERRARDGRVKEGHGDLRAEHICLEDEPVIFDCIEFSEEFRYCDTVSEIAFLAMDLDYLGSPFLANHLARSFESLTRDPALSNLLPAYKCFRACVRGKVETLKSREREVSQEERAEATARARRYFQLARRYVSPPYGPALLIVCGMVASGKSTLARGVGDLTGYQVFNSDVIRKQLAGIELTTHPAGEYDHGIYSANFNTLTYDALLKKTEECLTSGIGVIVDATFKDPEHRRQFLELASRRRTAALFVECRTNEQKTLERLRTRRRRAGEISDATIAVYLRQRREFVPLDEIPPSMHMVVNTEADVDQLAGQVLTTLRGVIARPP